MASSLDVDDTHMNGTAGKDAQPDEHSPVSNNIIDIRRETDGRSIRDDIFNGLRKQAGEEKRLPTLLLYDEAGLKLFEQITYLEEYYLTNAEIEVLEEFADRIAKRVQPGSIIVELGSGNLRKVNILLRALERLQIEVEYYALDLSLVELQRTLAAVPEGTYKHVKCFGLHGTYDDGMEWLKSPDVGAKPKTILSLGSSIGNFTRPEAAAFINKIASVLRSDDTMLIGIDACRDGEKVYHAYNDMHGITHDFILNGLLHANRLLGKEYFRKEEWQVIGEYVHDETGGRHQAFVAPLKDVSIGDVTIRKGERVRIEESYKWSPEETSHLWEVAGVAEGCKWKHMWEDYALHMVSKPHVFYPSQPELYAASPVPSLSDWAGVWRAWDTVTRQMIPKEELLAKPIKLRNACIFYLGHIPTFLDIHLTRATGRPPTEPKNYPQIFERGIDPDVDNPELCHSHSEIPDTWPPVEEILEFQRRVRDRVNSLYGNSTAQTDRKIGRALWIGYEHELMHLETLLYMLVQSEKTLPPTGTIIPDFQILSCKTGRGRSFNKQFVIPETDITIGMDDPEDDEGPDRYFGWDNEKPKRTVHVDSFRASAGPITNGEYAQYLRSTGRKQLPASWSEKSGSQFTDGSNGTNGEVDGNTNGTANGNNHDEANGATNMSEVPAISTKTQLIPGIPSELYIRGKSVKTVYGKVPLEYALNWPVFASYDELAGCAKWMGGRIPTMEEVRSIYAHAEHLKARDVEKAIGKIIPAVNGHLVNNGVRETPPSGNTPNGSSNTVSGPNPQELFANLEGANVGFKHWHPVSVTQNGDKLCGQGELGGVWEWTSTVLEKHEGFEAMDLYPGYTADFFDKKHNIVLGGSWATHPRIAGRKSFVNWYQRNYPYAWAGARVVYD